MIPALSDAILLGAMTYTEIRDSFIRDYPTRCCALGGAALAIGETIYHQESVVAVWPILRDIVTCPEPACRITAELRLMISHLHIGAFHSHRWSREQIAAWVATLEAKEALEESPCLIPEEVRT